MGYCAAPDCFRETRKGEFCDGHAKRVQRGQSVSKEFAPQYRSQFERVLECAIALADADSDSDTAWDRAVARLRKAAEDWAHGLKIKRAMSKHRVRVSSAQLWLPLGPM